MVDLIFENKLQNMSPYLFAFEIIFAIYTWNQSNERRRDQEKIHAQLHIQFQFDHFLLEL